MGHKRIFRLFTWLFLCLLCWSVTPVHAQPTTDEQLAAQYFQSGEFDKAALYYQRLYDKQPSDLYYDYYLKCLFALEDLKAAEKLVKRQIKAWPRNASYLVDLGSIYKLQKNNSKSRQQYDKALKSLTKPSQQEVVQLGKAFLAAGESEYALQTYQRGRKLIQHYPFNFEIAQLYGEIGNTEAMINEYLDLLELSDRYQQSLQNILSRTIGFEEETKANRLLKEQLLRRVQKNPNNPIYAEMVIWMYIQQKNFRAAFTQAKALDRRQKENGERVVALARMCASNLEFDISQKAYQYVIAKGDGPYYIDSKVELLQVMNTRITTTNDYTREDLRTLQRSYETTIDELGRNANTVALTIELATLNAYYLDQRDTAVAMLEDALNIPRVHTQNRAHCKLKLGDILLSQGEIWDASLYYSQVEKAFKHDVLGQQAKFKKAKIFYYTGDFKIAKAQLDVLKGSTSKLIANDALELSLLITDNTGIDTTEQPMRMFARADLLATQNRDQEALRVLDSINDMYPRHALEDEILLKRYDLAFRKRAFEEAGEFLQEIVEKYPDDILADNALFFLAELQQFQFKDLEKAKASYQELLIKHPGSLFVVEARKRFRLLRGDNLDPNGDAPPNPSDIN